MPLIQSTAHGLYCEEGGFHIDPWAPVERAVITHAHADHARPGSRAYLCARECEGVLRLRLGESTPITAIDYGETVQQGGVKVSLHPAGHILGSAQVRVESATGETWVVSGDYKVEPDPTCRAFEVVKCHTLITESTFGLPIYRWPSQADVIADINAWWRSNAAEGRTSLVFAWPLGKAQRVLAGLDPSIGPIGAHGSIWRLNRAYLAAGVHLPDTQRATGDDAKRLQGVGLVVAPPSTSATTWLRRLAGPEGVSTAFVSGWMRVRGARRRRNVDRGFVLSDHCDWPGLMWAVRETGAQHVGVTHGFAEQVARWLAEQGLQTFVVASRYEGESGETPEQAAALEASLGEPA
ncbi:MAG TPA: ligase-associated DNA damage response exonuclease [Phycisphaerales bacterium]|nr:ligase-associated DNA damage response exonuclease [Phycisphaerales bacterium]